MTVGQNQSFDGVAVVVVGDEDDDPMDPTMVISKQLHSTWTNVAVVVVLFVIAVDVTVRLDRQIRIH